MKGVIVVVSLYSVCDGMRVFMMSMVDWWWTRLLVMGMVVWR